jgi:hypothetical protein
VSVCHKQALSWAGAATDISTNSKWPRSDIGSFCHILLPEQESNWLSNLWSLAINNILIPCHQDHWFHYPSSQESEDLLVDSWGFNYSPFLQMTATKQALAQADNKHRQLLGADTNNQMPKWRRK